MKSFLDPEPHAALPEGLRLYAEALRAKVWAAYSAAGRPLGPTEEAMLIWYTFDAQVRTN